MIPIDCVRDVMHNQTSLLTLDLFMRMLNEPNTRMAIEQVRDHKNAGAKRWLPGICWQATFAPGYRKEANARPNGIFALDIDLRSFGNMQLKEHILLHHDDVKAINTEENPGNVVPVAGPGGTLDGGKAEIRIPALSWNVIRFAKAE